MTIRKLLETRDLKIGSFVVEFATPGIGQIYAAAGAQFLFVDMEHSGFGFDTLKSVLRYLQAAGIPNIVRVPSKSRHHVSRTCDMGAEGVMIPMLQTPEEANAILDAMKYVPDGRRGVALRVAHDRYEWGPVKEKMETANRSTALFAQIETGRGVENADAIAAIDGVDCLWIGHLDLSCSLGIPGQFDHKRFIEAEQAVVKACRRHNKAFGYLAQDVEWAVRLRKLGVDFLCYSGDVWLLQSAFRDAVAQIRAQTT